MNHVIDKLIDKIRKRKRELEEKEKTTSIIIFLLGAGGRGLEKRKEICNKLERIGIICLIPEIDLPLDVPPSLAEESVFRKSDVDLIFINVESWGSAAEFIQFHLERSIAPKLRILTLWKYHPIYGKSSSYLTDFYLNHEALYGHVYAYKENEQDPFPTVEEIIIKLSLRYLWLKAIGKI